MKNAIILHGCPEKEHYYDSTKPSESNAHWLPWLQKELIIRDIKADTPEIPHAYAPEWNVWCKEVERFDITPNTALIGHSCGAGFWLKYLSIRKDITVGKTILVAPWLDPDHTLPDSSFFNFQIDSQLIDRTKGVFVFYASDDSESVRNTVAKMHTEVRNATFKKFPNGYGHFTYENLHSLQFPELRDEIIRTA